MSNQELYDNVISAYKSGNENSFNAAAKNWMEAADGRPFEAAEANELFFKAKRNYSIWKSGAISSRVSKIRMIDFVRKIAEMDIPNPYIKPVKKEIKKESKNKQEEKKEQIHVLGIIPDVISGFEPQPVKKEPEEKMKEEQKEVKKLFNKHKRR